MQTHLCILLGVATVCQSLCIPAMGAKTKTRVVPLPKLVGRVSDRELVRIVRDVSEGGDLNIPFSREAFGKEVRSEFAGVVCERYLPLKEKESNLRWQFLCPNKLVQHVLDKCPELAEAYGRAANAWMPSKDRPWDLITAFDEFVPGDKLKAYTSRKCMVLGFNFEQLGEEIL